MHSFVHAFYTCVHDICNYPCIHLCIHSIPVCMTYVIIHAFICACIQYLCAWQILLPMHSSVHAFYTCVHDRCNYPCIHLCMHSIPVCMTDVIIQAFICAYIQYLCMTDVTFTTRASPSCRAAATSAGASRRVSVYGPRKFTFEKCIVPIIFCCAQQQTLRKHAHVMRTSVHCVHV